MKIAKYVMPVIAAGFVTSSAMGQGATFSVDANNTVAGVVANTLTADGAGVDWTASVLVANLSTGSVYNGSPDSNGPQSGFWGLPGFDILEWDTWVGTPAIEQPNSFPVGEGINDVGPLGAGDLSSPALSLAGNLISASWGDTFTSETGPTRIANLSLTNDATGTWTMLTAFAGDLIVRTNGTIAGVSSFPSRLRWL